MPCHAICSVRKVDGIRKIGRHRSRRFLKSSAKIGENQKNSAETHRWRNSENWEHRNAAGFGDKSAGFTDKPVRRVPDGFFQKPTDFCRNSVNGTKKPSFSGRGGSRKNQPSHKKVCASDSAAAVSRSVILSNAILKAFN
jgi:hypothetical protein